MIEMFVLGAAAALAMTPARPAPPPPLPPLPAEAPAGPSLVTGCQYVNARGHAVFNHPCPVSGDSTEYPDHIHTWAVIQFTDRSRAVIHLKMNHADTHPRSVTVNGHPARAEISEDGWLLFHTRAQGSFAFDFKPFVEAVPMWGSGQ